MKTLARLAYGISLAVLALTALRFPRPQYLSFVDTSWQIALNYGFEHRWRFGEETVFSFGPLGFLATSVYYEPLFVVRCLWAVLVALAVVTATVRILRDVRSTPAAVVAVYGLACALSTIAFDVDCYYFLPASTIVLCHRAKPARFDVLFSAVILAVLAHVKTTYLVGGGALLLLNSVAVARSRSPRDAILMWLSACAVYVAVWVGAGQPLSGLPQHWASALEFSGGYDEAMALSQGRRGETALALVLAGAVMTAVWLTYRSADRPGRLLAGAAWGGLLFIVFKHGFVRQDPFHVIIFLSFVAAIPLYLLPNLSRTNLATAATLGARRYRLICALLVIGGLAAHLQCARLRGRSAFAYVSIPIVRSVVSFRSLLNPSALAEQLRRHQEADRATLALPTIAARVGREPIDMLGYQQAYLFANGLNWCARPVFQSYAIVTTELAVRNGRYFASDSAPRYVLLRWQTLDQRLPSIDDSLAWLTVWSSYRPILTENGCVLMERAAPTAEIATGATLHQGSVRLGEQISLEPYGAGKKGIELDVRYSTLGKVRRLAFKSPAVSVSVTFDDGRIATYALIPGMVRVPCLIDPLPTSQEEMVQLLAGSLNRRVVGLRVECDADQEPFFEPEIGVRITELAIPTTVPKNQIAGPSPAI